MSVPEAAEVRPYTGQPDKRRSILTGALKVFARDGYTRAGVDTIAAEARVSTRTIYNHFQDKARLFQAVIQESASRVAADQVAIIDSHLRKVTDVESDLVELASAMITPTADFADHFALVRQINAEVGHVPQAAIDAWQETGPLRVRRELARRLQQMADHGLLRVDDPDYAALHFMRLVSVPTRVYQGGTVPEQEIAETAIAGVRAFLYGYAADPGSDTTPPPS